ncbi:MAG: UDP-N-acetylmuramoyl-L-alanine--D-glutamate ligase [Bacteroidales bacterium]|nr:UDP-N-acetylmuramoyl-L-alanine--D-glutamate ligase [Bacteroidales bacterium]
MKKLVILGGGETGVGSAILAVKKGYDTFLSDGRKIADKYAAILKEYNIPYEEGGHTEEKILCADEIIKSPGIPPTIPVVQKAIEKGIHFISEIEFAGRFDDAFKICITGSNGKTTTTSLIHYILTLAGFDAGLGGNIGISYARQVAEQHHKYYVLEISSFQLDHMYDYKCDIAVLTNVTPDHLDRYDHKMENYTAAKFRITQNMGPKETFICFADDKETAGYMAKHKIEAGTIAFTEAEAIEFAATHTLSLQGKHNAYNSYAAYLACKAAGVSEDKILEGLATFRAVEHRLEKVAEKDGVLYINDSKATNIDAAYYALECQTRPVVWIVGGTDKGNDYSTLAHFVKEKVKAIVCLGVDNSKIHAAYESLVPITDSLSAEECVKKCSEIATEGDVVLLSPCCASFDLFKNYEDRGRQFKEAVRNL